MKLTKIFHEDGIVYDINCIAKISPNQTLFIGEINGNNKGQPPARQNGYIMLTINGEGNVSFKKNLYSTGGVSCDIPSEDSKPPINIICANYISITKSRIVLINKKYIALHHNYNSSSKLNIYYYPIQKSFESAVPLISIDWFDDSSYQIIVFNEYLIINQSKNRMTYIYSTKTFKQMHRTKTEIYFDKFSSIDQNITRFLPYNILTYVHNEQNGQRQRYYLYNIETDEELEIEGIPKSIIDYKYLITIAKKHHNQSNTEPCDLIIYKLLDDFKIPELNYKLSNELTQISDKIKANTITRAEIVNDLLLLANKILQNDIKD